MGVSPSAAAAAATHTGAGSTGMPGGAAGSGKAAGNVGSGVTGESGGGVSSHSSSAVLLSANDIKMLAVSLRDPGVAPVGKGRVQPAPGPAASGGGGGGPSASAGSGEASHSSGASSPRAALLRPLRTNLPPGAVAAGAGPVSPRAVTRLSPRLSGSPRSPRRSPRALPLPPDVGQASKEAEVDPWADLLQHSPSGVGAAPGRRPRAGGDPGGLGAGAGGGATASAPAASTGAATAVATAAAALKQEAHVSPAMRWLQVSSNPQNKLWFF